MEAKSKEQELVIQEWIKAGKRGTYQGTTGVGKTRVGVLIKNIINDKTLIVVPTENLRDIQWPKEIKAVGDTNPDYTIECIQTSYKRKNEHWPLLIIDEVHACLGEQFRGLIENNTFDNIICLSATVDDKEKQELLAKYAPIFYKTPLKKAVELGIIAPYKVYNLPVDLTRDEKEQYDKAESKFQLNFKFFDFNLDTLYLCLSNPEAYKKHCQKKGTDYKLNAYKAPVCSKAIATKKSILYNAVNKIQLVKEICEKFNDRKTLIFSESIDFAEKITTVVPKSVTFHSKVKESEKLNILEDFKNGKIKVLSSVKALNAGFDVPDCSLGIIASGTSTKLDFFQRLGRTLRFEEDKLALFIQLYVPNSQEEKWINSRTSGQTNIQFINSLEEITF